MKKVHLFVLCKILWLVISVGKLFIYDFDCKLFFYFKGSLLVNVSRGGILDYKSILRHLETGHLGGLGIDVAWTEPFDPNDPVLQFKNVLITPHVAGVTEFSYRTMAKVLSLIHFNLIIKENPSINSLLHTFTGGWRLCSSNP